MFSDVAHELDGTQSHEPVRIVAHQRATRAGKIEKTLELMPNAPHVLLDDLERIQRSLGRSATRVTDEASPAANKGDWSMAGSLQMG
jgi:hypothetical protein